MVPSLIQSVISNENYLSAMPYLYGMGFIVSSIYIILYLYHKKFFIRVPFRFLDFSTWIVLAVPFWGLIVWKRLDLDYWLDELISIIRHILPSVRSAVLYYPVPNNHVFSNLINNLYLQLMGWQDLQFVLRYPIALRFLQLIFGILTLVIFASLIKSHVSLPASWLAVILFATTIPWLNIIVQIRGYSLSLLFSSLLLYQVLSYLDDPIRKKGIWISLISSLLLYTIPSNIYFLLAVISFVLLDSVISRLLKPISTDKKGKFVFESNRPHLSIFLYLIIGFALAWLFYLPVLDQIFDNQYVLSQGLFQGTVFKNPFPKVFNYMISGRLSIFVIAGVGYLLAVMAAVRSRKVNLMRKINLSWMTFFLPFLFSFFRGDKPFPRVFFISFPSLILGAVLGLDHWMNILKNYFSKPKRFPPLFTAGFFIVCNFLFFRQYFQNVEQIRINLETENKEAVEQDDSRLWASHFLDHYHVYPLVTNLIGLADPAQVYIDKTHTKYEWVPATYLDAFEIKVNPLEKPEQIQFHRAYYVTSYPSETERSIQNRFPKTVCNKMTETLSIYQLLYCIDGEIE